MIVGLGISALGSGYNFLIRSLLASVVETDHIGMLYTRISIFETVGVLVAGPLLAMSFRTGMVWGGGLARTALHRSRVSVRCGSNCCTLHKPVASAAQSGRL
jgi:hypothetical protein